MNAFFLNTFKRVFSLIAIVSFTANLYGQSFENDYKPLTSVGPLPEEFVRTAKEMAQEDMQLVENEENRSAKQQFAMRNNYFLKNLLLGGNVLVNDPLTKYVNKVVDQLLIGNPSLRSQLHVYVTKSPDVNAYAFDKGFVFVNVGLLAQLENEAQLAFILAHEITHVMKKHSVSLYLENIKIDNGSERYERDERTLEKYRFSKEQESEADIEGLKMIKQSNYSVKALNGAFDVLQYSYLPFEIVDFNKSFFEDEHLILPDTLFLKKTSEIKSNDDYDDTKSTHPNIRKRRGAIEADLKAADESTRKKFLVSEEEFKTVRETARFELCRLYMIERDYVNSIYAGYILLQKYPNNIYLNKMVSKALYNIAVNKSGKSSRSNSAFGGGKSRFTVTDHEKIEGASQRLYYMLDQMTATELNVVALSFTFKAFKKHPSDKTLSNITDSLFSELVNSNSMYLNNFSKLSKTEMKNADTMKTVAALEEVEESKYSKIKREQAKVEITTDENFTRYAFVGLLKDEDFVKRFTDASRGLTQKASVNNDYVASKKSGSSKKKKSESEFLGIDKVAFVDPFYMKVKNKNGQELVDFFESEKKEGGLLNLQNSCADKLDLSYVNLSTKDLTTTDIEKYNNNALINEWLTERFKHGNTNEMITSSEDMAQLIQKLGTKYIAWGGVYNNKTRRYHNTYFFMLFDLETGETKRYETRYTTEKDNKDLITAFTYNSLMCVSKKAK